jgi:hypothetical protein
LGEGRRVIRAVTGHRHHVAAPLLAPDEGDLFRLF